MKKQRDVPIQVERAKSFLKSAFGDWREWLSLFLLLLTLGIAIGSIEYSRWIAPQPSLLLVLVLSVVAGLLLVKSRLPTAVTFSLGFIFGIVITVWQVSKFMLIRADLITAFQFLLRTITADRPSESNVYFAVFLVFITWGIGFLSTWLVLRKKNAWFAVFAGAAAILINISYLNQESFTLFFFYLLSAMLLISQLSLAKREFSLRHFNFRFPRRGTLSFMATALCLSLVLLSVVWVMPAVSDNPLQAAISTEVDWGKDLDKHWMNIFASVPAKSVVQESSSQEELSFAAPDNLSEEIQFLVTSPVQPSYWRTRRYDIYQAWGWTSSPTSEQLLNRGTPSDDAESVASRSELTYTVVNKLKTDIVLTAGEFVTSDVSVLLHAINDDGETTDITAITSTRLLKPNQSYKVTASVSSATPDELLRAGEGYPQWVKDRYLQLPSDLPGRVRQLTRLITRQATTPYAKALAIKTYLAGLSYLNTGTPPPEGEDGVSYFLNHGRGNCTNFASAMVVMLRSVGVPSRFCAGFLPHEWDETTQTFTVRAKDYHAWAEVYFPGYGWIEFEATPPTADTASSTANTPEQTEYEIPLDESALAGSDTISSSWLWLQVITPILATILLLYMIRYVFYTRPRRLSRGDYAFELYARMCLFASLVRLRPKPQQTPLEYGTSLTTAFPAYAQPIGDITQSYLKSRFSQTRELGKKEKARLGQSWRVVSQALLKRLFHLG